MASIISSRTSALSMSSRWGYSSRMVNARQNDYPHQVSYFHGCYVQYNFPQLGKDLVTVMNAVGYGVQLLEKEKCCGVAKIANRLIKEAKRGNRIGYRHTGRHLDLPLASLAISGHDIDFLALSTDLSLTVTVRVP